FGASLSRDDIVRTTSRYERAWQPLRDSNLLQQVINCYDSAIAWLDHELGRLLARVPANTLVVVFSDHGEAFKEHGRMLHSGLYEEEVRVPLLLSRAGSLPDGLVVNDPVMLLDVAPTVLAQCDVPAPTHYEGRDLAATWTGGPLPERLVLAESQA